MKFDKRHFAKVMKIWDDAFHIPFKNHNLMQMIMLFEVKVLLIVVLPMFLIVGCLESIK